MAIIAISGDEWKGLPPRKSLKYIDEGIDVLNL